MLPANYGGQKAVAHFTEQLAQLVPVVMLCSKANQPEATSYNVLPQLPVGKWQFVNPRVWAKIYKTAKHEGATHLLIEFPYHGIAGWLCKQFLGLKLIVNTHNTEGLRFRQQGVWWWRLLHLYEGWVLRQADAVFFKTEADKLTAQNQFGLKSERLLVVPYGVSKPTGFHNQSVIRKRHHISVNENLLLFSGTLDYAPNAEAVIALFEKIAPLLDRNGFDYQLLITGRNKTRAFKYLDTYRHPRIQLIGEVTDIDKYLDAADTFVSPVLTGGGIQTKLLDAVAMGRNVVCFASKSAGITETGNKLFTVEDGDWETFANAVEVACQQKLPTPDTFYKKHHWRTIATVALHHLK